MPGVGGYAYEQVFYGNSLWRAVIAAVKAKRAGSGCVKVHYFPSARWR